MPDNTQNAAPETTASGADLSGSAIGRSEAAATLTDTDADEVPVPIRLKFSQCPLNGCVAIEMTVPADFLDFVIDNPDQQFAISNREMLGPIADFMRRELL